MIHQNELANRDSFGLIQFILSKTSHECAFRRFPRILSSRLLQHELVEIDTSQFAKSALVSDSRNCITLKLDTDPRRLGMLPLCTEQKVFPKDICQMLVIWMSYVPKKQPEYRFVSILGVISWTNHRNDDFDESRTLVNMSRLSRNLEQVDSASVHHYELLSAPPPLFVLRSRLSDLEPSAIEAEPPSPRAVLSFALMWFAAAKAYGDQESGRKKRALLLSRRSCRFFGVAPPRDVLFGTREGFQALGSTMSMLEYGQRAASFASNQLCSAFEMLYDTETRALSHARVIHFRETIAPLINSLANINAPQHNFVQPIFPLNFRAATIRELINDQTLTETEVLWLCGDDAHEVLYNDVCVSYRFGGGENVVTDAILYSQLPQLPDRSFIKGGIVFVRDESLMKAYAMAAMRLYLDESAGANRDSSLEETLEATLPLSSGFFPKVLNRERSLDDCSKGTPMFSELVKRGIIKSSMIASLENRTAREIPLPDSFDAIELLQLYKEPSKRTDSLVDPIEMELALLTVTHTDLCRHLTIEYDHGRRPEIVQALKDASAERERQSQCVSVDHALMKKASNRRVHSELDDIEDLVSNLHTNRALPLCIEQHAQILLSDSGYLKYNDRAPYYKRLVSLGLPELSHEAIKRHMLQTSPAEKIRDHLKEIKSFPTMAEKAHENAARFLQREMMKKSSTSISQDESMKMTSTSAGCYRMAELGFCPFSKASGVNVEQMLIRAGVDERRAGLIAQKATSVSRPQEVTDVCVLHLHSSMTVGESSPWPAPFNEAPPRIKRAHDFVHHMARYRLHRLETHD